MIYVDISTSSKIPNKMAFDTLLIGHFCYHSNQTLSFQRGIIRVQQQVYVLKPKKNIGSQHVIKLLNQFNPATNEKHCSNGDSLNTINTNYDDTLFFEHRRTKREVPPEGSRLYMEIAVFVDQHLFNHMKTNFPKDTESEVINVVLAMINAVSKLILKFSKCTELLQIYQNMYLKLPIVREFLTKCLQS